MTLQEKLEYATLRRNMAAAVNDPDCQMWDRHIAELKADINMNIPALDCTLSQAGTQAIRGVENYLYQASRFAGLAANTQSPTHGQIVQGETLVWYSDGYKALLHMYEGVDSELVPLPRF